MPTIHKATKLHTVTEIQGFAKRARERISDEEYTELINAIADNPKDGTHIGSGLWKKRWAGMGRGKRSGFRVYYIYSGVDIPIFLVTIFAKSEKDDLSKSELNRLTAKVKQIIDDYRSQSGTRG